MKNPVSTSIDGPKLGHRLPHPFPYGSPPTNRDNNTTRTGWLYDPSVAAMINNIDGHF